MCISIHHVIVNSCCWYKKINVAVLNVGLIKPWVNTLSSDNKTEHEVERKRAGLSFLIVNLGVPWALRPNSPVLSQSCPKRVLFFFFRRELPHSPCCFDLAMLGVRYSRCTLLCFTAGIQDDIRWDCFCSCKLRCCRAECVWFQIFTRGLIFLQLWLFGRIDECILHLHFRLERW